MKKIKFATLAFGAIVAVCLTMIVGCGDGSGNKADEKAGTSKVVTPPKMKMTTPSADQIQKIAEDAYLYGLQQVIYFGQRWNSTQNDVKGNASYSGVNRLSFVRNKITPDFPIVTPNATTLYGFSFIDLQKEPVVIEHPAVTDRYFSFQIMDQYGIFFMMVGNQFNGTEARSYLLVPPGYSGKLPGEFATTEVIQSPSRTVWGGSRLAVMTGTDDEIKRLNGYQDKITVTPLSKWIANGRKGIPWQGADIVKGDYPTYAKMGKIFKGQVDKQTTEDFLTILNIVLNDPSMTLMADSKMEANMLARLEAIGIGRGKGFDWSKLDKTTQDALTKGFENGYKKVKETFKSNLIDMNGWMTVRNAGGFETDWLSRAVMADAGWGGPDKNVSHGAAFLFVDADGKKLNGKNKYTMTFDMKDLPPVTQFWSIPIYNIDGYFVANKIDRYTINRFMLDQKQLHVENGKLVVYLQKDKPADQKQLKNWLPAPPDNFRFAARFYGPKMSIIDGSYKMPKPVKVN